ncbi:sensor histidine kinase [Acetivibrio ethanolgignens]|uniref:histidine kinase n=1 Tax=Acetivibrio ethanolgignens TaxID=290052 RepID=A0A0V8QDS4_9FIRM|nr:HAMP domain-containing sensor histidine kinase [Acetivibrio ethanolgignens]KSV58719.1 histidine kinase [Acetivibrio ethanolgignens]
MKSVPKLIRRFVAILLLSSVLIFIINFVVFAIIMTRLSPNADASPYKIATETGKSLQIDNNEYMLSDEMSAKLNANAIWAILVDNDTLQVVWKTENVPNSIPSTYTLSDIADLAIGYIDGYPTYTGETANGIVVLGFPKDSFWKHTRASWNYSLIANFPHTVLMVLLVNIFLILLIYIMANIKLLKSVKPITAGIQDLSAGEPVHIPENGLLSEISANINHTSDILQEQQYQLRKKGRARANWIAGVSHDIRTPLSMVMGYAGQLENSQTLSEAERKKATVIVKQSKRMKDLINDLNLASKLEYNMQPLTKKQENAVAVVRQVVVDFMNMDIDDSFPIQWETDDELYVCNIDADKDLLRRAVANLIQNSINHNENGCTIYVSVISKDGNCIICVEDNGVGVSDEQIEQLNNTPHYMVCDTNTTEQRHGLGLLIVKQIINSHDGKTIIEHSKFGGFKVVLTIPQ